MNALGVVEVLLNEKPGFETLVAEASVHLPHGSGIFVAAFTGPTPGEQVTRSTGLRDRAQALALAKHWEAQARRERASYAHLFRKPTVRVRHRRDTGPHEQLTQKEVATLLNISERGVREIERRAFQKLRNHPLLKRIWQQYLAGDLDEDRLRLTDAEIVALFALTQNETEYQLVTKVLRLTQS